MKYKLTAAREQVVIIPVLYCVDPDQPEFIDTPVVQELKTVVLNLRRIIANKTFTCLGRLIYSGTYGGLVESGDNLDQEDNSWICEDSVLTGNSRVSGDSWVKTSHISWDSEIRRSSITGCQLKNCLVEDSTVSYSILVDSNFRGCYPAYSKVFGQSRLLHTKLRNCTIVGSLLSNVALENEFKLGEQLAESKPTLRKL